MQPTTPTSALRMKTNAWPIMLFGRKKLDKNMSSVDSILENTATLTAKLNEIDLKTTIEG